MHFICNHAHQKIDKLKSVVIGDSFYSNQLREDLSKAINSKRHIIFTSEAGSEADILAHLVHELSDNSNGNFTIINDQIFNACDQDDFIYGKCKGSRGERKSIFTKAKDGVLFFNGIKQLSTEKQSYLHHVMKTGYYFDNYLERVRKIRARIILNIDTTHEQCQLIDNIINDSSFMHIMIPTLNQRKSDIIRIAKYEMAKLTGNSNIEITNDLEGLMSRYHWPGGYQELMLIASQIQHTTGNTLSLQDLPEIYRGTCTKTENNRESDIEVKGLENHLKSLEVKIIRQTLIETNSNISATARRLYINRTTLIEKMKRMKISKDALFTSEETRA